jgi:hypothetical protein
MVSSPEHGFNVLGTGAGGSAARIGGHDADAGVCLFAEVLDRDKARGWNNSAG